MNTLSIEGWRKPTPDASSVPIGELHFRVNEAYHLLMEQYEEEMAQSGEQEKFIDIDMNTLELATSEDCGELTNCRFRVFINPQDHRGRFHLIAEQAGDNSLVYSNAVMIDQLG